MTDTEDDDRFGNEPTEVEEPKKKRRKKRKRGRIITVEDMPRKVREEFRTDQKAEKFLRLLGKILSFLLWNRHPIFGNKIHTAAIENSFSWIVVPDNALGGMVPHFEGFCFQDLSIRLAGIFDSTFLALVFELVTIVSN